MSLPERYSWQWREPFAAQVESRLIEGMSILDVGSGSSPTLHPGLRPERCCYVGLDVSAAELARAPEGSYDETVARDIATFDPSLEARFDLVVSWQVFEHVKPLGAAVENCRRYLKPGGALVTQFSGLLTLHGVLNRALPHSLSRGLLGRLNGRPAASIFPAHYDRCWPNGIHAVFESWQQHELVPLYYGAEYLRFSKPLQRMYLVYENWAYRTHRESLATHYIVTAER